MRSDYSLYLVTDRGLSRGRSNLEIVRAAIAGGATAVQLREKQASSREFLREALAVRHYCREHEVMFIINDRVDIALAVDADGVHLGQDDLPIEEARKLLPSGKLIGISAFDIAEAKEAERAGADYIGVSPIFVTPTKPELERAVGLDGLRQIRRAVRIPLVAIGGINPNNACQVMRAGADGLAVVSAIVSAENPEHAAAAIKAEIERARKELT